MPIVYVACNNTQTGDGSDGSPYGDLNYALAQEATNLGALGEPLEFRVRTGTAGGAFSTHVEINDTDYTNADSTHYIIIRPDEGYEPVDGASQLSVTVAEAFGFAVEFAVDYTVWDGIDIRNTDNTSATGARVYSGYDNITIRNCVIQGSGNGSGQTINSDGNPLSLQNCLLLLGTFSISNFTTANVTECVVARSSGDAIAIGGSFGVLNLYNTVFYECNTDVANSGGTINASNNATSKATGTNIGTSPVVNVPSNYFEDESENDFRLVVAATGLIDAGTGSGLPSGVINFDRFGTSRPQGSARDIGYHEFSASTEVTGSGILLSGVSTASGTAERVITGSGTLEAQATAVSGSAGLSLKLLLTQAQSRHLVDEDGAPIANLEGIIYEWYDTDDSTDGNPTQEGTFDTDENGEATIQLPSSQLTSGQFGTLILYHPSDDSIRGIYRVQVT